jgi:hypothetical protein
MNAAEQTADEVAERLFGSLLGLVEIMAVFLGDRLGWYRCLADAGPASAVELARRTGTHSRYAREWLEQQAVAGLLTVDSDGAPDERRFAIPTSTAEVMTDPKSLVYLAPFARMFGAVGPVLPQLVQAYRQGGGVSWETLGNDARESQADANRPWYETRLGPALTSVPALHTSLAAAGCRILDVGCGAGWSSISLARAYPSARVLGVDIDQPSIDLARRTPAIPVSASMCASCAKTQPPCPSRPSTWPSLSSAYTTCPAPSRSSARSVAPSHPAAPSS